MRPQNELPEGFHKRLLASRVTHALQQVHEATLVAVNYHCLDSETNGQDLGDEDFYLGGEVELVFDAGPASLRITWDENAGWEQHFSVRADIEKSYWNVGVLKEHKASNLNVWHRCIGQKLHKSAVYGRWETPFVIVLVFGDLGVAVGSACGGLTPIVFGDGDDVFV